MVGSTLFRLGLLGAIAAISIACTVESYPNYGYVYPYDAGSVGSVDGGEDTGTVSAGSPNPSPKPMLARVDPNVKMNVEMNAGQGVGVFTEYDSGGHWSVLWTCDTSRTAENCPFDIKISAETGAITGAVSQQFGSTDTLTTPSTPGPGAAGGIEAKTLTTTGVQGVLFNADPGATILLSATISGLYNGQFLFWVQSGQVNGGYNGAVTDPLLLVALSP